MDMKEGIPVDPYGLFVVHWILLDMEASIHPLVERDIIPVMHKGVCVVITPIRYEGAL
jgi:hypothetical protein